MSENTDQHIVTIHDVRLSYPALFRMKTPPPNKDGTIGKAAFKATFLLDPVKNARDLEALYAAARFVKQQKWLGKPVNLVRSCILDGNTKEATDGYKGMKYINASETKKPQVVGHDLAPLAEDSGKPYAGCYVDATLRCWAQENTFGRALNWALVSVQYRRKGPPFGEKQIDVRTVHQALPDEEEDGVDQRPGVGAAADDCV